MADCREGKTTLSPRLRPEEVEGVIGLAREEGEEGYVASEVLDLAFPLL